MARPALAIDQLPADAISRREALEERARPNQDKPKLAPEQEARLAQIEEKSAQCYIQNEEMVFRLHRAAKRINSCVPRSVQLPVDPDTDG